MFKERIDINLKSLTVFINIMITEEPWKTINNNIPIEELKELKEHYTNNNPYVIASFYIDRVRSLFENAKGTESTKEIMEIITKVAIYAYCKIIYSGSVNGHEFVDKENLAPRLKILYKLNGFEYYVPRLLSLIKLQKSYEKRFKL